jgi:sugar phosphate isomerase/epimerase
MTKPKLCFSTLGLPNTTLERAMAIGARFGFQAVEIRGATGAHLGIDDTAETRAAAVECAKSHKLAISCLMGYTNFSTLDDKAREASIQSTLRYIQLAKDINAPVLRIFGGQPEDHDIAAAIPRAAAAIAQVTTTAAEAKVILAIESHDAWCHSPNVLGLVNKVNHPNLKICWDPANAMGIETPAQSFTQLKNHIVHVHLKDIKLQPDGKHIAVLPGTGDVPMAQIARLLQSINYTGAVSLEWEKWWIPTLPDAEFAFRPFVKLFNGWYA